MGSKGLTIERPNCSWAQGLAQPLAGKRAESPQMTPGPAVALREPQ